MYGKAWLHPMVQSFWSKQSHSSQTVVALDVFAF
ncbi:hypothetical protein AX13_05130 [Comamonas aquatica DA1877]|uniref:Uncharacterized protein n=1 Tax=Comamonas aquatica DA1877 TaxID=1457173 RepID=A0A014MCH5_9BURK|nr:hypothetical protein AX13_05130 [Comamonas aquatica DA1877]